MSVHQSRSLHHCHLHEHEKQKIIFAVYLFQLQLHMQTRIFLALFLMSVTNEAAYFHLELVVLVFKGAWIN